MLDIVDQKIVHEYVMNFSQKRKRDPTVEKVLKSRRVTKYNIFDNMFMDNRNVTQDVFESIYTTVRKLGSGFFGITRMIKCNNGPNEFALKEITSTNPPLFYGELMEVVIHFLLNHIVKKGVCMHIPRMHTAFSANGLFNKKGNMYYVMMESINGKTLKNHLMDIAVSDPKSALDYTKNMNFIRSVLFQLVYTLHCAQRWFRFVHHDLHPENIMLHHMKEPEDIHYVLGDLTFNVPGSHTNNHILKMIDFGLSRAETNFNVTDEFKGTISTSSFFDTRDPDLNPKHIFNRKLPFAPPAQDGPQKKYFSNKHDISFFIQKLFSPWLYTTGMFETSWFMETMMNQQIHLMKRQDFEQMLSFFKTATGINESVDEIYNGIKEKNPLKFYNFNDHYMNDKYQDTNFMGKLLLHPFFLEYRVFNINEVTNGSYNMVYTDTTGVIDSNYLNIRNQC
jgi:serine/threonine protein kinase